MDRSKFKRIVQIATVIFVIFLVLFYIPAGSSIWSDRNYAPGSPWPNIFTYSGIGFGVIVLIGWLILWNSKK